MDLHDYVLIHAPCEDGSFYFKLAVPVSEFEATTKTNLKAHADIVSFWTCETKTHRRTILLPILQNWEEKYSLAGTQYNGSQRLFWHPKPTWYQHPALFLEVDMSLYPYDEDIVTS
jgi:hypothetical protein